MRVLLSLSLFVSMSLPLYAKPVIVPGGGFQMGCSVGDEACEKDEGPVGGVSVDGPAFKIDSHEVTVAEFRQCIEAGKCSQPLTNQRNKYCNYGAKGRDDHPVNCLDWSQAEAYCGWKKGRLPYEAEWEKAARAGSKSRYPWGERVSCQQAILDEVSPAKSEREPDGCGRDTTWPVGSRGANAFGLFDMHGNVGEWTMNWYAKDAIAALYAKGDLTGAKQGKRRVVRGGSWDENRPNLRSSFRNVKFPEQGKSIYGSIGFRCAYDGL